MIGITGYGAYIPKYRITIKEITQAWGRGVSDVGNGYGIVEKSVAGIDEDAVTMGVEASLRALTAGGITSDQLEAVLVGSESNPYAVKPSATSIGGVLNIKNYFASDLGFACKSGTAGLFILHSLVKSRQINSGIAIGTDAAQSKPGDVLECTAGSGAAAYIIGKKNVIAKIICCTSFSSDTLDFWRRDGEKYPTHAGRFTGEPSYFKHVLAASTSLFKKIGLTPSDFQYCVFHMPNGKFPIIAAKKLGFSEQQITQSLLVKHIGNPYSASTMLGLASILDTAKPKDKIFACSYGSGAGSDAFAFEVTDNIKSHQKRNVTTIAEQMQETQQITYVELLRRQLAR